MRKTKLVNYSIFTVFFLALGGYYAALILVANLLSNEFSRMITMPIRIVIVLAILFVFLLSRRYSKLTLSHLFFLSFSFVYFVRIIYGIIQGITLYMSPILFLLYFLSFVFIPLLLISNVKFDRSQYIKIFWTMVFGCFLTSLLTGYFYNEYIGLVARITTEVKLSDNYISPLALSYVSVLGIGLCLSYFITNKVGKTETILLVAVILFCFIPFFLGASRGAIVALAFPFIVYLLVSKRVEHKLSLIIISFIFIISIISASTFFGTGVFDRFFDISGDIERGSSSAIRLVIWKTEIINFMNYPVFGYSLQSAYADHHPHNILVEALIATGLVGSIPYFSFLVAVFLKSIIIIRKYPKDFWLVILFYMGFAQNMFSGAIWGSSFMALGAALILGYDARSSQVES